MVASYDSGSATLDYGHGVRDNYIIIYQTDKGAEGSIDHVYIAHTSSINKKILIISEKKSREKPKSDVYISETTTRSGLGYN